MALGTGLILMGALLASDTAVHLKGSVQITTLSSQPDRVSGGDALVQISFPVHTRPRDAFSVFLNGVDVSKSFHSGDSDGEYVGLVNGLRTGRNRVDVRVQRKRVASLKLMNYPIQGPIVSGPHLQPFVCQTSSFELVDGSKFGPSLDQDCSASTKIVYLYMSTATNKFTVLKTVQSLPSDVAKTTTENGSTVNFIVRVETATINRGIYESAVLHDPSVEPLPSPFYPPRGWNRVLIGIHGIGCAGGWFTQGGSQPALDLRRALLLDARQLARGYAFSTNTLQNPSDSCNAFLAGETAMMGKERFIKTYGMPDYSLTIGDSGGAYTSLQIIDAFPGLFDGALIGQTFPDVLSIALSGMDAQLLRHYFIAKNPAGFTEEQQVAITGYGGRRAWFYAADQAGRTDPVPNRNDVEGYHSAVWNPAVPVMLRYHPQNNKKGARPTLWDVARNIYGIDPTTTFALRAYDNIGVQYGLGALNLHIISKSQFLDLNEQIGGFDPDDNYVPYRTAGDKQAIVEAYASGLQLSGRGGLAEVPIVDLSGEIDEFADYHHQWFHFAVRDRLAAANGESENFVMWRGSPTASDTVQELAFDLINRWITAIKSDNSQVPFRKKIVLHKPNALVDGCWTQPHKFVAEQQVFSRKADTSCNRLWPSYAFPRFIAGGPLASNVLKCQLKPINLRDYAVSFTAEEAQRLHRIYQGGVCDWSKPGKYFRHISVGISYGPAPSR